ncbi:MAG: Hpt domain-containing protein [Bdellovibrionaceae bacterium]|nr:Hpt domain-containing protein [Pseudobdellovibrionaceae bacterium]
MKTDQDFQKMINGLSGDYLDKVLKTVEKLIKENNIQNIYEESHKLKGSGKTYGFVKISDISSEVEELCKQLLDKKEEHIKKNKNIIIKKIKQLKCLTKDYQKLNIK